MPQTGHFIIARDAVPGFGSESCCVLKGRLMRVGHSSGGEGSSTLIAHCSEDDDTGVGGYWAMKASGDPT